MNPPRQPLRRYVLAALVIAATHTATEATEAYKALGLKVKDVLSGTILNSKVVPGGRKQVVCVATYLTGKREKSDAVGVRLGVFDQFGDGLVPIYTRDIAVEHDGDVGNGELQLIDLDLDGINEIIVSFDNFKDPLIEERLAEVILHDDDGFRVGWSGALEYDATKAARNVPRERRDRYVRAVNYAETLRTRGVTLFFDKSVVAIAGERLPEPRVVQETFPLRERESW